MIRPPRVPQVPAHGRHQQIEQRRRRVAESRIARRQLIAQMRRERREFAARYAHGRDRHVDPRRTPLSPMDPVSAANPSSLMRPPERGDPTRAPGARAVPPALAGWRRITKT